MEQVIIKPTPTSIVFDDADTGDEILWFLRLKRPYLYLRDRDTKLFIKGLDFMELRLFMVVDYSENEAKKGNPLYVDVVGSTLVKPDEVGVMTGYEEKARMVVSRKRKREVLRIERIYEFSSSIEVIEAELEEALIDKITELFGGYVADELLDLAGVEYGSIPKQQTKYQDGRYHYDVVWKHHKQDEPRAQKGDEAL